MRIGLGVIVIIAFVSQLGFSQGRPTTSYVDATTYEFWLKQDWDSLIHSGNNALKQGIDFYYLRYRLGVAWYEKKNYHQAIRHFQAAHRWNPESFDLLEYLYYAYVFSGRTYEARSLENTFPARLRTSLNLSQSNKLTQAYINYSYQSGAPASATARFDTSTETEGYQTISTGYHLTNLGIEHRLGSRFWLHHSYTHLQNTFFQYYNLDEIRQLDPAEKIYLNQYYLGTTALIRPGLDIRFGFHYIHLLNYENSTLNTRGRQRLVSTAITRHNITGFVSLYRRYRFVTAGLSAYAGNLNAASQYQQDAIISIFPFGNLNFYAVSTLSHQLEKMTDSERINRFVYHQRIGLKLIGSIWAEAEAAIGEHSNFLKNDGLLVINDTDHVLKNYSLGLHSLITGNLHLRINYVFTEKESRFVSASSDMPPPENIFYNTQSITATIIWKR